MADNPREHVIGNAHEHVIIPLDDDLVRRAMRNVTQLNDPCIPRERWAIIKDAFAVGSTTAKELCEKYGLDPYEMIIQQKCYLCQHQEET